eukprot:TRINITY_DN14844_c0_g1_i1.p1 TRINITY_DN14844_c0_g1~~TRINITY_DN14844_c0_g1_i1.p1  ORF type:complete len:448 (+),score=162.54 TRINITY_DN14844_c0_g1_i1:48-1391(+)
MTYSDVEAGGGAKAPHLSWRIWLLTAVGLFKSLMGTGLLSMPKAMHDTGVLLFPVLLMSFSALAQIGCVLITRTIEMVGDADTDPGRLGAFACGAFGKWLAIGASVLDSWGAAVAFLRTVYDTALPMLEDAAGVDEHGNGNATDGGEVPSWMKPTPVICALTLAVFPMTLFTQIKFLDWVNSLGSVSLFACLLALFVHAAGHHPSLHGVPAARVNDDALLALSVLSFTYDGLQLTCFPFYRDLPPPKDGQSRSGALARICVAANLMGALFNFVIAIVAFATFRDGIKDNVLNNLPSAGSPLIATVKVSFAVCVLLTIPVTVFEAVHLIREHVLGGKNTLVWNLVVSGIMMGSAALAASLVPNIYQAFAYVGATSSLCWTVIIPPLFFIKSVEKLYPSGEEGTALVEPGRTLPPKPSKCAIYGSWVMLILGALSIPLFVYIAAKKASS